MEGFGSNKTEPLPTSEAKVRATSVLHSQLKVAMSPEVVRFVDEYDGIPLQEAFTPASSLPKPLYAKTRAMDMWGTGYGMN